MTEFRPEFVVVGNVNQGKSSIVASLIENASVPIASYPGTTEQSARYAFTLGDETLFTIIDTPGFQEARAALAWMKERAQSPAERPQAVQDFVIAHDGEVGEGRFSDEVRLLKPVMAGASILYVVDASSRFQPAHEAEMEILRWTGQPAMALINRTRDRDHSEEWRPVLEQFFNIVRSFNAHDASLQDRLELLAGFKELREAWREPIDRALATMRHEAEARAHKSAQVIAELLVDALSHVEKRSIAGESAPPGLAEELETAYQDRQRQYEARARSEIEQLYQHRDLQREETALSLARSDLFSDTSWRLFGLDRGQLARYGAGWGAVLGGAVDAMVSGASFLAGAFSGALVGGLGGYFAGTSVARTLDSDNRLAKLLFSGDTGHFLFKGPVNNPRYAWMLLDRALTHYKLVRDRSHARQDQVTLDSTHSAETEPRIAASLDKELRDLLDKDLREIIRGAQKGAVPSDLRPRASEHLLRTFAAL